MELAPIVLFCYNRSKHTQKTLESLSRNYLASESELFIYCDGPKSSATKEDFADIKATREIVKKKQWCKKVTVIERDFNYGLAKSITTGVSEIVNQFGKIIVLEDDIVTSNGFLQYMNEALAIYSKHDHVMHVSGFMWGIDTKRITSNTFFYNFGSCWGWGTWKDAWSHYEGNTANLIQRLANMKTIDINDYNKWQNDSFFVQLLDNYYGNRNTWAVKWHTSIYINGGFCLHPINSLVINIGLDGTGVNNKFSLSKFFIKQRLVAAIEVTEIEVIENELVKNSIKKYFRLNPFFNIHRRITKIRNLKYFRLLRSKNPNPFRQLLNQENQNA